MTTVIYTLELLQPLLATGLDGDPNSKRSLEYIPGSMVRGVLTGSYLRARSRGTLSVENSDDQRFFLGRATRYLNAYPQTLDGHRSLPTPLSWLKPKTADLSSEPVAYDYAIDPDPMAIKKRKNQQVAPLGSDFCWLDNDMAVLLKTKRRIHVHTARDRAMGRATVAEGAVFQYDALAPGRKFTGAILANSTEDAEELASMLRDAIFWLGGSRSAGYGMVRVIAADTDENWQETQTTILELPQNGRLVLTCLSPCIIRDAMGNASADLDLDDLTQRLGIASTDLRCEHHRTRRTLTVIGGFNRTWGLPLCQVQAIAAGSVFVFTVIRPVQAKALQVLQREGIGERVEDGFGRLAVNWQSQATIQVQEDKSKDDEFEEEPATPDIITEHQAYGATLAMRMLRRELDDALALRVQSLHLAEKTLDRDLIKNSQLARLRVAARNALVMKVAGKPGSEQKDNELTKLLKLFNDMKSTAADQFDQARLDDGRRLAEWLRHRLEHQEKFWDDEIAKPAAVQLGTLSTDVPEAWAIEYTIRLIDGVLAQAAKDKKMRRKHDSTEMG